MTVFIGLEMRPALPTTRDPFTIGANHFKDTFSIKQGLLKQVWFGLFCGGDRMTYLSNSRTQQTLAGYIGASSELKRKLVEILLYKTHTYVLL